MLDVRQRPPIAWEELRALFALDGWAPAPEEYLPALRASWLWTAVYDGAELVAFCRVLSDGVYHAYLCNMVVRRGRRRQGIGTLLVRAVLAELRGRGIRVVCLAAVPASVPFYAALGFRATDSAGDAGLLLALPG
jgi:GNAT superfamily N-acetyltransferase